MDAREFLNRINRRQFLGSSAANAAGVAAGVVGAGIATAAMHSSSAADRVRLGVIGVHGYGAKLAREFAGQPDVEVAALCDVDPQPLHLVQRDVADVQKRVPRKVADYRQLLDDARIDAVVIATPDHWHAPMAIEACRAGKDVYLEPPVTLTQAQGQLLKQAVDEENRVLQTGLQQRSGQHFQSAVEYVRSGRLGAVKLAKAWTVHRRRPLQAVSDSPSPTGVDYDNWLGTAPPRPFNANHFHQNWQRFWDYSLGELGGWGVHLLDVARWGLNVTSPQHVAAVGSHSGSTAKISGNVAPDTLLVSYRFPQADGDEQLLTWEHRLWSNHGIEGRNAAVAFYGEQGTLIVDRGGWKVYASRDAATSDASPLLTPHCRDFIDCIRTRNIPIASLQTGIDSTALAWSGAISCQLGRQIEWSADTGAVLPNDV